MPEEKPRSRSRKPPAGGARPEESKAQAEFARYKQRVEGEAAGPTGFGTPLPPGAVPAWSLTPPPYAAPPQGAPGPRRRPARAGRSRYGRGGADHPARRRAPERGPRPQRADAEWPRGGDGWLRVGRRLRVRLRQLLLRRLRLLRVRLLLRSGMRLREVRAERRFLLLSPDGHREGRAIGDSFAP